LPFFTSPNRIVVLANSPQTKMGLIGALISTIRNFGRLFGAAAVFLLESELSARPTPEEYAAGVSLALSIDSWIALLVTLLLLAVQHKSHKPH
jgi:hypothetical protein